MGLYLTVFDGDEELDGVEIGFYSDFAAFRALVARCVERGRIGSKCPTLMTHSDCDGEWLPDEASALLAELSVIRKRFEQLPPIDLGDGWQSELANSLGLHPKNLNECFFDVDGVSLLDRLSGLARLSVDKSLPILFQ